MSIRRPKYVLAWMRCLSHLLFDARRAGWPSWTCYFEVTYRVFRRSRMARYFPRGIYSCCSPQPSPASVVRRRGVVCVGAPTAAASRSPVSYAPTQIPIRGDDFSWEYEGRGATDGKQVKHAAGGAMPTMRGQTTSQQGDRRLTFAGRPALLLFATDTEYHLYVWLLAS